MKLDGKVALVTGAGRRLGSYLAVTLGRRGANVAVHYHGADVGAKETADLSLKLGGATALTFGADLTLPDAPAKLIDQVHAAFGGIDILVNSAAIMKRTLFGSIEPAEWDKIMALNLRAPFFLAQAAAPHLRQRRGTIVNIADLAAFETWPGYVPHGVSKSGVVYVTKALARLLAPDVRVNAIAPGTVLLPDDWSETDAEHLNATTPLKREGTPQDVAEALLFLVGAEYVTGETIIVDGGRHVRR